MPAVLYEKKGHVAYITLNRPDVMNALDPESWQGITDSWIKVRDDREVWVAIVSGAGDRAFSAGADLKWMAQAAAEAAKQGLPPPSSLPLVSPLRGMEVYKPFIAAVNGFCLGGGLELALICDIRIASETARFGLAEVTRAIIPGAGGTQRLMRTIPFSIAIKMLITGEAIDAQEAYRVGLVSQVVPVAQLMPTAEALAAKISLNGPLAVQAVKEVAYRGSRVTLDESLRLEQLFSYAVRQSEDAKEGPRAFAEKRKPNYQAR